MVEQMIQCFVLEIGQLSPCHPGGQALQIMACLLTHMHILSVLSCAFLSLENKCHADDCDRITVLFLLIALIFNAFGLYLIEIYYSVTPVRTLPAPGQNFLLWTDVQMFVVHLEAGSYVFPYRTNGITREIVYNLPLPSKSDLRVVSQSSPCRFRVIGYLWSIMKQL